VFRAYRMKNMPMRNAEVTDAVRDEGLLAGVRVGVLGVPEADEQVGAEAHTFPAHEHEQQVLAHDQHEHENRNRFR
jgi:hypothetical protein